MAAVTTSGAVAQLGRAPESHWRGFYERGDPVGERECLLIKDPIRFGWGKENPSFRQLFTARFIPEGTVEQVAWFNELCRRTTTGEIAAELLSLRGRMNVGDLLERVRVPTLVMHAREDNVTPLAEGGLVASLIPDRNSSSSTRRTTSCRRTSRPGSDLRKRFWSSSASDPIRRSTIDSRRSRGASVRSSRSSPKASGMRRSASVYRFRRRQCGATSRACTTSSAWGRGRRRWYSRAITASVFDYGLPSALTFSSRPGRSPRFGVQASASALPFATSAADICPSARWAVF